MTKTKTYTFWGRTIDGESVKRYVDAKNMKAAVASFMSSNPPDTMGWFVRQGGPSDRNAFRSHRVSREKFGHAFDGDAT